MKKAYVFVAGIASLILVYVGYGFISTKTAAAKSFAVVELFTSEGCSSCPAADNVLAKFSARQPENVYILAYHVDYWNRLGWKDVYSKAEFSDRQPKYAEHKVSDEMYTPQLIINGSKSFVGSQENTLNTSVANALEKGAGSDLTIRVSGNSRLLYVTYNIKEENPVLFNVAVVQPEATSQVQRGENRGKTLHHVHIVRALKTMEAKGQGVMKMDIPQDIDGAAEIVAFTQSKSNYQVLGADRKKL